MLLDHRGFRMDVGGALGTPEHWLSYTNVARLKWASWKDLPNGNVLHMELDDGKGSERKIMCSCWLVISWALVGNLHPSFCSSGPPHPTHPCPAPSSRLRISGPCPDPLFLCTYCVALLESVTFILRYVFNCSNHISFYWSYYVAWKYQVSNFFLKEESFKVSKSTFKLRFLSRVNLLRILHQLHETYSMDSLSLRQPTWLCMRLHLLAFSGQGFVITSRLLKAGPGLVFSHLAEEHSSPLLPTLNIKAQRGIQWTRTILLYLFTILQPGFSYLKSKSYALNK